MIPADLCSRFEGRHAVVTGGAGFVGSHLTRALLRCGARVTVVDNLLTGKRENLEPELGTDESLALEEVDLASWAGLRMLVAEADFVFHLAAMVGNLKSIEQPVEDARTNVLGSIRLYECCRGTKVRKVVYSSSSAMFGEARSLPVAEDHPQAPESFYALSKMAGEHYALLAESLWGLPTVCLRYFNIYGLPMEYNEYTGVISIFFDRLDRGDALTIYGDGSQSRDFVSVDDIVQANLRAALLGDPGSVFNIGTGTSITIRRLAELMVDVTGTEVPIEHEPFRKGEVRQSVADIRAAAAAIGYHPQVDLRSGLASMWDELRGD